MLNTWVRVAFAFFVVFAFPAVLFARHADSAGNGNVPTATMDSKPVGKCFRGGSSATTAAPDIVRSTRVCWAPQDANDDPGV